MDEDIIRAAYWQHDEQVENYDINVDQNEA
jgi:hypothetical protein